MDREALRAQLVRTGIAGEVATPRENNLEHYRRMAAGDPRHQFGLTLRGWTFERTLDTMARLCGVRPDPRYLRGIDTIDPELTVDALEVMGKRIGAAAERRETVMFATGHPGTLMGVYRAIEDRLRAAGCAVSTPSGGWSYAAEEYYGSPYRELSYTGGVAALVNAAGDPAHTHDPQPMRAMLRELANGPRPDLVIADHGWAGAAGEAGIDTVGFADCNDPALFAGQEDGKIVVTVPLDDGIRPAEHYVPLTEYLLARAGFAESGAR
ncbi:phosphatase [Nocardia sp. NEAU-351]|uniref:Phosphatase n=1 Tax=Nocardia bovistercoris TaxID=2785916 RepID=A0A931IBU8_9NOCA|nr:phosphatase [Nocardia bovistercoris]